MQMQACGERGLVELSISLSLLHSSLRLALAPEERQLSKSCACNPYAIHYLGGKVT